MKEIEKLQECIKKLSVDIEKMRIAEYVQLLENPKKLLYLNFISGVARGLGTAFGITILGAIVLYILQKIVVLNLPYISDIISDIVRLVREQSY